VRLRGSGLCLQHRPGCSKCLLGQMASVRAPSIAPRMMACNIGLCPSRATARVQASPHCFWNCRSDFTPLQVSWLVRGTHTRLTAPGVFSGLPVWRRGRWLFRVSDPQRLLS
jgi:hypothetical protein